MWFVELNGRMDDRRGRRQPGRTHHDGRQGHRVRDAEPTGSPINIAVGPDRNIWFTKENTLGRVTPDGDHHRVRRAGRWDGIDRRQRPRAGRPLVDKLWFAQSGANKIAYMSFR